MKEFQELLTAQKTLASDTITVGLAVNRFWTDIITAGTKLVSETAEVVQKSLK